MELTFKFQTPPHKTLNLEHPFFFFTLNNTTLEKLLQQGTHVTTSKLLYSLIIMCLCNYLHSKAMWLWYTDLADLWQDPEFHSVLVVQ